MCSCCKKANSASQFYLQECHLEIKGNNVSILFSSGEASPGVLCPVLYLTLQKDVSQAPQFIMDSLERVQCNDKDD